MSSATSKNYFLPTWFFVAFLGYYVIANSIFGESKDWENYNAMFDGYRINGISGDFEDRIEPGFKLLFFALQGFFTSNIVIYAVIAALSLLVKCYAINSVSGARSVFLLTMAFYLFSFAPLHEATQLRAALAISFLYLSYIALARDRFFLLLLAFFLAVNFHLSALVLAPFLVVFYLFKRGILVLTRAKLFIFSFSIFFLVTTTVSILLLVFGDILLVVSAYQQIGFGDEPANPFSATVLLNIFMIFIGIFYWNDLTKGMQMILVAQAAGAAFFYAALDFQVVAYRVYELIQAFWVFYVADGLRSERFHIRLIVMGFISAAAVAYSYIYFVRDGFFL